MDNTGKHWDALGEQMHQIEQQIAQLAVAAAEFGLVSDPASNYAEAQREANVSVGRSAQNFTTNATNLGTSANSYSDAEATNTAAAGATLGGGVGGGRVGSQNSYTIH